MKNMNKNLIMIFLVISVLIMAGCSTGNSQKPSVTQIEIEQTDDLQNSVLIKKIEIEQMDDSQNSTLITKINLDDDTDFNTFTNCNDLPTKLNSCTTYECEFIHPFDGQTHLRTIFGLINGKCKYVETMPNGGKMECNYSESMRKAVAQYYQNFLDSQDGSFGMSGDVNLATGDSSITYTIDGVEVENPLAVAMSDGTCMITGY